MSLSKWEIPFRNDSGETIPAFGVIRVTGATEIEAEFGANHFVVTADKSNTYGSQYTHYLNGPVAVADGAYGTCTSVFPAMAKHDGTTSPTLGKLFGPRDDSWVLNKETGGFIVLKELPNDIVIVERMPMLAFTGRFDSSTSQGSTGTVSVYWQGSDTTQNITGVYAVSGDFATTDDVNVSWLNERWEAYCRSG